jgi:hypothetical protein
LSTGEEAQELSKLIPSLPVLEECLNYRKRLLFGDLAKDIKARMTLISVGKPRREMLKGRS